MNRRDGIMRLIKFKLDAVESEHNRTNREVHLSRCKDLVRLLEDCEKDNQRPPLTVWGALKHIVRTSEAIVEAFDSGDDIPSKLVEILREDLKELVDCETAVFHGGKA